MDLLFEAHLSTTAYFTTFRSSVKGFPELLLMSFSSHLEHVLLSTMGWGPSEFSYLAFTGLPYQAKPLRFLQRAEFYRDYSLCQGILRPISPNCPTIGKLLSAILWQRFCNLPIMRNSLPNPASLMHLFSSISVHQCESVAKLFL